MDALADCIGAGESAEDRCRRIVRVAFQLRGKGEQTVTINRIPRQHIQTLQHTLTQGDAAAEPARYWHLSGN